jgi:hypothetical protein
MLRSMVRSILGIVLVALATWAADRITDVLFGADDGDPGSA